MSDGLTLRYFFQAPAQIRTRPRLGPYPSALPNPSALGFVPIN
jgi:hypothetical protein